MLPEHSRLVYVFFLEQLSFLNSENIKTSVKQQTYFFHNWTQSDATEKYGSDLAKVL